MTYQSEVAADSPVYWYKVDETSGSTYANSGSAGTLNAVKSANVLLNQTSPITGSKAIYLPGGGGGNSYLGDMQFSAANAMNGQNTYEFWVKTSSVSKVLFKIGNIGAGNNSAAFKTDASGKWVVTYAGTTISVTSTNAINDNNWHHLVAVIDKAGGTVKTYIDGVLDKNTTGLTIPTVTTASNYFAYYGDDGSLSFTGYADEWAIYTTNLTGTRIAAHYAAATVTNIAVDVTTPTMAMDFPAATQVSPIFVTVDTDTPTMSMLNNDVTVEDETVLTVDALPSFDGSINTTTGAYGNDTDALIPMGGGQGKVFVAKFNYPTGVVTMKSINFKLNIQSSNGSFIAYNIYPITADWAASGTPTLTLGTGLMNKNGGQLTNLDVSSIVDPANFYGFYVERTDQASGTSTWFYAKENGSSEPTLSMVYSYEPTNIEVDVTTPTAAMAAVDNTVQTQTVVDAFTPSMTAENFDVVVEAGTSPDVTVDVPTPTMLFTGFDTLVSINTVIEVTTPTESAQSYDAEVVTVDTEIIEVETGRLTMVANRPSEVNGEPVTEGEDDDRYFIETRDKAPIFWYRGNESTDNVLPNRGTRQAIGGVVTNLVNHGATIAIGNGPESRKTIGFDGNDYLLQTEAGDTNISEATGLNRTLEFTFKTGKSNQFLMGGADGYTASSIGDNPTYTGDISFYLADGKLRQRRVRPANVGQNIPAEDVTLWTAFTNLADNQWHHVAIKSHIDGGTFGQNGFLEVWVDDKLEIRRVSGVSLTPEALPFGFPDYIGGRPGMAAGTWFEGNMTEIALYDYYMSEDDIIAQRDAMFGIIPVRPETGRMTMKSNDATVKGNKTRMLWLDFGFYNLSQSLKTPVTDYKVSFESFEQTAIEAMRRGDITNSIDVGQYQFFHADVYNWIDERTEARRMINLDIDVNMDDYDAIGFIGYPKTSDELSTTILYADQDNNGLFGRQYLDKLMNDIKTLIVGGKNVLVTNPQLAADLGFINNFEFTPTLRELFIGNNDTQGPDSDYLYDAIAAQRDVFENYGKPNEWAQFIKYPKAASSNDTPTDAYAGRWFQDTHANDRYRIRRLVPGLTDIATNLFVDELHFIEPISFATDWIAYKYASRPNGLTIGDEFYWEGGIKGGKRINDVKDPHLERERGFGTFAAPISAVKAGTIVATFSDTIGQGTEIVTNPYKDYATVIAIEPGSTLPDGRTVSGKVFIDFTDKPLGAFFGYAMPKQLIPSNDDQTANLPINQRHLETDAQRAWDFSKWRGVTSSGAVITTGAKYGLNADGTLSIISAGDSYTPTLYSGWWPLTQVGIETMMSRGFIWLSKANENNGNALVGVDTARMTMDAKNVTIDTTRNESVDVPTARVTMDAVELFDAITPDANVLVPTPSMTMTAISFQEIVEVETGVMTMTAHEIAGTEIDETEIIGLTLHGGQALITLNIKEEA